MIKKEKGFTLIELLVVIFIIGVLTAVVLPNLIGARQRGRDAKRKQDLESIKNALRLYYNDNQAYPDTGSNLTSLLVPDYMVSLPAETVSSQDEYGYVMRDSNDGFYLTAQLEVGDASDSHIPCGVSLDDDTFVVCAN